MNWNANPDRPRRAFTLLELLVVISIIGLLAVSSVPAIRALTQTNTVAAGHRQLLDDLAYARRLAISGRRTVYLVFVPPTMRSHFAKVQADRFLSPPEKERMLRQMTNLLDLQFTGYALFTRRTVGDQPGRDRPRYLTEWKELPEGILIGTNKFVDLTSQTWLNLANNTADTNRPLPFVEFPFPNEKGPPLRMPYIAFDSRGRVHYDLPDRKLPARPGEAVPLVRGSIFYPKTTPAELNDPNAPPDIVITENAFTNLMEVRVDWLTGRAKVFKPWEQTLAWK